MARIAISGFGRVGRLVLRAFRKRYPDHKVVAINDLADLETNAYLFRYDTTYGKFPGLVETKVYGGGEWLNISGGCQEEWCVKVLKEKDPAKLPWRDLGVDIVIESTGVFTKRADLEKHLHAGARKVILTAPASGAHEVDFWAVVGVNHLAYNAGMHQIVSNASCTTNCLAPVVKTINDAFGIERGFMNTIHSFTNDQRVQDIVHKDLRRARAASQNMIPTSTGAASAIGLIIPELQGKLDGQAIRVPVLAVSVVDLYVDLKKEVTKDELNKVLEESARGRLHGIMDFTYEPLVSSDYIGHTASAVIDGLSTNVKEGRMAKVLAWYDNEWGYSCRITDLADLIARQL